MGSWLYSTDDSDAVWVPLWGAASLIHRGPDQLVLKGLFSLVGVFQGGYVCTPKQIAGIFFKSIDSCVLCKITYLPGLGAGP